MGRVALQDSQLPSQHQYRSLRRYQAKQLRDQKLLTLQLEIGQLKYERDCLQNSVLLWDRWYQRQCAQNSDEKISAVSNDLQAHVGEHELPASESVPDEPMPAVFEGFSLEQEIQTDMVLLPALLTASAKCYSTDDLQATIDSLVLPIARERDHAEGLLRSAGLDLDVDKCSESQLQRCIDDAEACGRMKTFAEEYEGNNRHLMSLSAIFDQLVAAMTKLPPIITQVNGFQSIVASTATHIVRMRTLKQSACQAASESSSGKEVEDPVVQSCDAAYQPDPFRIQGINKRGMVQPKRKKKR